MSLPARCLHGACILDRAGRYRGLIRHKPKGRSGSAVEVARKAAKWCADSNGKPYRWKPYERAAVRGHSPEAIMVLPTMPMDDDTAAA
jgi:hypothetical protein